MKRPEKLKMLSMAEWCMKTDKECRFLVSVDRKSYNQAIEKYEAYHNRDIKENYIKKDKVIDENELQYCPKNCKFLNITEEEQNKNPLKPPHNCKLTRGYTVLLHNGHHPKLLRCEKCMYLAKAIIKEIKGE